MGIIKQGILGGFSGSVGPVVGSSWKGINYMKTLPTRTSKSSTVKQIEQQLKFALMVRFCQTMSDLLEITFKNYATEMTGFNAAFSYNIKNAVGGTSPDFEVDYQNALVSRGNLPNGGNPQVATGLGSNITVTWVDNSDTGAALATDKAIIVMYCKELNITLYTIGNTTRSAGTETIDLASFSGQQVQVWLAFTTENEADASNSFFAGTVTVG